MNLRIEERGRVGNWVANTNHALRLAGGEYACFLHQDDLWLPGRLSALKPLIERSRPRFLLHPAQFIDRRGRVLGPWRCPLGDGPHSSQAVVERLLVQNFVAIPSPIFSRDAALSVGGLDESLWYAADWDFWLKLAGLGPVVYHARTLAAFRVHGGSQTMQGTGRAAEMRRQLDAVLERHLTPGGKASELVSAARLSVEVNGALAGLTAGGAPPWGRLARGFLALGPGGVRRYLRDSRLVERVLARLRARW
jgi:hypothetical protein